MTKKRFSKDYSIDGWPIVDNEAKSILGTDDLVKILNEFDSKPRFTDDPLADLAAVIRHHNLEISSIDGITIAYIDAGIVLDIDTAEAITADDIKPEK